MSGPDVSTIDIPTASMGPLRLSGDGTAGLVSMETPTGNVITLTPDQARALATALGITSTTVAYAHEARRLGRPTAGAGEALVPVGTASL